jgi:hypothetical protein
MYKSGFLVFVTEKSQILLNSIVQSIIFETDKIDELCKTNRWSLQDLTIMQLKIGLFYHDLGLIKKGLKRLESKFDLVAIRTILAYISSKDSLFISHSKLTLLLNLNNTYFYSQKTL